MWEIILNVVLIILSIVLAGVTFYLDTKKNIQEQVNGKIDAAEDTDKKGEEKMAYVVEQLKALVPKALRFMFTDKVLENIVQKAFDKIEDYAQKQVDKKKSK